MCLCEEMTTAYKIHPEGFIMESTEVNINHEAHVTQPQRKCPD